LHARVFGFRGSRRRGADVSGGGQGPGRRDYHGITVVDDYRNGEFNVTEFGSTKDPAQFNALYDYSPLLRIKDGVKYPAALLTTGDNDGRVAPYESRKLAARLQAASASGLPILPRTDAEAGHGIGTALASEIEKEPDVYTFLVDQLGIPGPVKAP